MWNKILRFKNDRRGAIAVAFAVALYPILMMICAAVDLSRHGQQQARLQAALDAAALFVARLVADGKPPADLSAAARAFVIGNINPSEMSNVVINASMDSTNVLVTGSGQINPIMANILSAGDLMIRGTAGAAWRTKKIELVLVLDNTGSMSSSGKMTALKTAAKSLIDTMAIVSNKPDAVRIGIVPFDVQVRLGTSYKNESWLTYAGTSINANSWTGCVADRDQSHDVADTAPNAGVPATLFPARNCTNTNLTSIMPLSTDWTALKAKVDAMSPAGNTNVTIGLVWGLHMLTASQPLTTARTLVQEPDLERIIILLTDGDNTQNRWTTNGTSIDARTDLACTNTKANGIRLYTIRVINGDAALLRRCATTPSMYFDVRSASELVPVFQRIAAEIGQLRLTQ